MANNTSFKKGHKPWNTGKKRSPFSAAWRKKMSDKLKGNTRTKGLSWKVKNTLNMFGHIPWNKGKKGLYKHTSKTLQKISKAHKGKYYGQGFKKGNKVSLGRKNSEETKLKMRISALGKNHDYQKGEKNHNWKDGKSFEKYTFDWTKTLKQSIRERDKYICYICKKLQTNRKFSVHHIDYNKKNCDPKNLITLCVNCHTKTNYNREKWLKYFKNYV